MLNQGVEQDTGKKKYVYVYIYMVGAISSIFIIIICFPWEQATPFLGIFLGKRCDENVPMDRRIISKFKRKV